MKILIAYDTYFLNTTTVVEAIAAALEELGVEVQLERIYQVNFSDLAGINWFLVGAPTHLRKMPSPIKSILKRLPKGTFEGIKTLAFDTRYKMPVKKSGSAARQIDRLLVKLGGESLQAPESFFVQERRGPLYPGEVERARSWAAALLTGEKSPG